jgi:hypothetical protein
MLILLYLKNKIMNILLFFNNKFKKLIELLDIKMMRLR